MNGDQLNWGCVFFAAICCLSWGGCKQQSDWKSPSAGLISKNKAAMLYILPDKDPGVVFFRLGDLNSSSSHTSNPVNHTFDYSGTLTTEGSAKLVYQLSSSNTSEILINKKAYILEQGRVFIIDDQGELVQHKYEAPLPTHDYLAKLKDFASQQ